MVVVTLKGIEKRIANELALSVMLYSSRGKMALTRTTMAVADMAMDEPDRGGMKCSS